MRSLRHDSLIAVVDAGTTNIKVLVFDNELQVVDQWMEQTTTYQPKPGWYEQDGEVIFQIVRQLLHRASRKYGARLGGFGVANQRESVIAWHRKSSQALTPLVLWQDKRNQQYCDHLAGEGYADMVRHKTGMFLSAYPSASKLHWLTQSYSLRPELAAFGTLDSWLTYRICGEHKTDYTNASRTLLYNIRTRSWDAQLTKMFDIDASFLPSVEMSAAHYGETGADILPRRLPLLAIMGDQQASLYAVGTDTGTVKVTYGTGIFAMKIIGAQFMLHDKFLTTLAVGEKAQPTFAYEVKVTDHAADRVSPLLNDPSRLPGIMEELAHETAPWLEQLLDERTKQVIVDGGITQNDHILQTQAHLNNIVMTRQSNFNGTALGVAKLIFDSYLDS